MTCQLICTNPMPPAVAQRAQAEFNALLSQDQDMGPAALLQALAEHPEVQAVLAFMASAAADEAMRRNGMAPA